MAPDLIRTATFSTPLGPFGVAIADGAVVATGDDGLGEHLVRQGHDVVPDALEDVGRELAAYFDGSLRRFRSTVDLRFVRGAFGREVLTFVRTIPYGELRTYGDVAAAVAHPRAARAVGTALRRCPIELFVPCHRVVPAGPGWGSYGGEDDRRLRLLRLEGTV